MRAIDAIEKARKQIYGPNADRCGGFMLRAKTPDMATMVVRACAESKVTYTAMADSDGKGEVTVFVSGPVDRLRECLNVLESLLPV